MRTAWRALPAIVVVATAAAVADTGELVSIPAALIHVDEEKLHWLQPPDCDEFCFLARAVDEFSMRNWEFGVISFRGKDGSERAYRKDDSLALPLRAGRCRPDCSSEDDIIVEFWNKGAECGLPDALLTECPATASTLPE